MEQERISKLPEVTIQYSPQASAGDLSRDIESILAAYARKECYGSDFPKSTFLRFWVMPEGTRKTILYNTLHQGCKANPSFSYKLYL